jgi:hypothetical protein
VSPRYSLHLLPVFGVTEIHRCHDLFQINKNDCSWLWINEQKGIDTIVYQRENFILA